MPDSRLSGSSLSTLDAAQEELTIVKEDGGGEVQGRIVCQFGTKYYEDKRNAEGLLCRGDELKSYT